MAELPPLFAAEWAEVIKDHPTQQELNPSWDKYIQMEVTGLLGLTTVRKDKVLKGYILNVIHPHMHFSSTLYGFVDAFYIDPELREGDTPEEFLLENEIYLLKQGVKRVNIALSASSWQYRLMKKLGYGRTEFILSKWL